MSHDRGCHCGKERYEYNDCLNPFCYKKDDKMFNTNKTQKYICVRSNGEIVLLEDKDMLIASFNSKLRGDSDRYYLVGEEVKVITSVEIVTANPSYR